MAPWWIRPTADGETNDRTATADEGAGSFEPAAEPREPSLPGEETNLAVESVGGVDDDEAGGRSRRSRGRRGRGRSRAIEPAESEADEGIEAPRADLLRSEPSRPEPTRFEPSRFEPARFDSGRAEAQRGGRGEPSLEQILRDLFLEAPLRAAAAAEEEERKIALFCDFENIALGVRDSESKKFELYLVLDRLREKGKVIVKKAYSDWSRYAEHKKTFHEAGIELIEIPQKYYSGKNSADIKMVVDAMDLCYSNEHIDTFVIMSGDSDFSPLVSKLKENNKHVIGLGVKNATSSLLIDNCDEFIYYEDLWRDAEKAPLIKGLSAKDSEAFGLLTEAMQALIREDKEILWGSMIKQTMKRKRPSFNEGYYGYRTFSELLEDAEKKGVIRLKKDQRSGSYIVTGFAGTASRNGG